MAPKLPKIFWNGIVRPLKNNLSMPQTYYVTAEGLEGIKKELEYLKTVKRKEIAFRIEKAKELGDLSENGEYQSAREDQSFMEGRIEELDHMVRHSELILHKEGSGVSVEIGSTVRVAMQGKESTFTIVGAAEANPLAYKISNESPLGSNLLGRRVGDEVEYKAPKGMVKCEILEVH